jgi:hypothetical protein
MMRFAQMGAHRVWTLLFGCRFPILGDGKGKAETGGSRRDVGAGMDTELGQDVADMVTDRLRREVKLLRDVGITAASSEERKDF